MGTLTKTLDTSCGETFISLTQSDNGKYCFQIKVNKFESCAVYDLISDSISRDLNSNISLLFLSNHYKDRYRCKKRKEEKPSCIEVISNFLIEFYTMQEQKKINFLY